MPELKRKGAVTELQCISAFIAKGYTVSIPYGDMARYDFVAEKNNKFLRIQCKTSRILQDGSGLKFNTRSTRVNTEQNISSFYSKEDIDLFATIHNNVCYIVPVEECTGATKTLRFTTPKNNIKNVNYADNYKL